MKVKQEFFDVKSRNNWINAKKKDGFYLTRLAYSRGGKANEWWEVEMKKQGNER